MRTYRSRTLMTLGLAAGLLLTACGTGASGPGTASDSNVASTSGSGQAAAPVDGSTVPGSSVANTTSGVSAMAGTAPEGATTVTFWQNKFEDYQQAWFAKQVKAFNASQNKVFVNYVVVPGDVWDAKLKAAQAAGTQPDVQTTNYGSIAAGVHDGKFVGLDGLLPDTAFADVKDNVAGFVKVDGKNFAYPMLVEPSTVLYYRKDLVTVAGLDPDKPPANWDELVDWAGKLTTDKVKGMTIASTTIDLGWSSWGLQYNACGHLPITPDWSAGAATDPCYDKLLDLYGSLFKNKYMPQQPKVGYPDATPYINGEVAMMANGSWAIGQIKGNAKIKENTVVAPFPSVDGAQGKTTATLGGWSMTIDSRSKNQQAAAEFINWLLAGDPKIMADFFAASGFSKYTVRKSVDETLASNPDASSDPFMKTISEKVVPFGKQEPGYPIDISNAFAAAIESVMKGKSDNATALADADSAINRVIQQQRLAGTGPGSN